MWFGEFKAHIWEWPARNLENQQPFQILVAVMCWILLTEPVFFCYVENTYDYDKNIPNVSVHHL